MGIRRVKGVERLGRRIGNWLSGDQAQDLINAVPSSTLRGKRDAAVLGLHLGCGLRRSEAVTLPACGIRSGRSPLVHECHQRRRGLRPPAQDITARNWLRPGELRLKRCLPQSKCRQPRRFGTRLSSRAFTLSHTPMLSRAKACLFPCDRGFRTPLHLPMNSKFTPTR